MKSKRALALVFVVMLLLANHAMCVHAVDLSERATLENEEIKYTVGSYMKDGVEQSCIVKVETSTTAIAAAAVAAPDNYAITYRTTYYIPTTEQEENYTKQKLENHNNNIGLLAIDNGVDDWWQCSFTIEVRESVETRYTQLGPNEWGNYKFVGIEWVRYGYYAHEAGEGKAHVTDANVRAWVSGWQDPATIKPQVAQEENNIVPPNGNYRVPNKNSLIQWTPPSDWVKVAAIPSFHKVGATFEATVVNEDSGIHNGETCQVIVGAVVAK